ncbi:MAG: HigA family addiction module antitoxin [Spirochaeta sp.]|jgi:addiction module HigA family antidote|nr:HigA family addiction module antitoxin [Spirochaeta sp.]
MNNKPIYAQLEQTEHPGEYLMEAFDAQDITPEEFAERAEIPLEELKKSLACETAMTAELAIEAERIVGGSARLWLNLDTAYRLWLARQKRRSE